MFVEQACGRIAMPAVRVRERLHEFRGVCFSKFNLAASLPRIVVRDDSVDATAVIATIEVEVLLDFVWDAPRVLDDLAIHIADVQASVRCIGKVYDSHPGVLAR